MSRNHRRPEQPRGQIGGLPRNASATETVAVRRGRLLFVVHQFFPQFHSGTETLCERVARVCAAAGWQVDILTSVLVDPHAVPAFRDTPYCPEEARAALSEDRPALSRPIAYDYAEGISVQAFTHSHDPAYGVPRFRREVRDEAIETYLAGLIGSVTYDRVVVFHLLHFPLRVVPVIRAAGIPISFVATDFFAVCPLGNQQYEDGRACAGPGPGSIACVRHLSDRTGWFQWLIRNYPGYLSGLYLEVFRMLGPWRKLPIHPYQNLYYLLQRNRLSRRFLQACDTIIAPSSRVAESLRRAGVGRGRITRMAYGMPPARLAPRPVRRAGSPLRLCYVGQTTRRKGLHVLLEALRLLPLPSRCRLDIWGEFNQGGEYAAACREEAETLAPHVALRGTFGSYRIYEVLDGYDYLVIPSIWSENLPLVLLSALQIGLPVIVSDAQGLLDAFPQGRVHGRSFRMGDAGDLARVLAEEIAERPEYRSDAAPPIPDVNAFAARLLGLPELAS